MSLRLFRDIYLLSGIVFYNLIGIRYNNIWLGTAIIDPSFVLPVNEDQRDQINMEDLVYAPWQCSPFHLNLEEVQQPLSVLQEFFFISCPATRVTMLREWRECVVNEQFYNDENDGPGHLLFVHEWNIKMLEGLYLVLLDYKANRYRFMPVVADQLIAEEHKWSWYPHSLTREEQANPYDVIDKIFKKISLPKLRDYLKEWLHAALYKQPIDESMSPAEILLVFDSMEILYGAAWLIRQRVGTETENEELDRQEDAARESAKLREQEEIEEETEVVIELRTMLELTPKFSEEDKPRIEEMLQIIIKEVPSVRKILFLGSQPKRFTCYLLIVIDDADKTQEHEIASKIENNCKPPGSVFVIVQRAAWAKKEIAGGDHFWNAALSLGINLYTADGFTLPNNMPIPKKAWIETARKDWNRWGKQGLQFLKGAKRYLEDENYEIAAFMLHQAAESCLAAIIRVLSGYKASSHNLSRMLKLTLLFTVEISSVLGLENTQDAELFDLLQSGYSEARYKTDYRIDEQSAKLLLLQVQLLVQKIEVHYLKVVTTPGIFTVLK